MFHFQQKRSLYVDTTYPPTANAGEKEQDSADGTVLPPIAECPAPTAAVSPTLGRPIPPPRLDGECIFDTDEQKYKLPRFYLPRLPATGTASTADGRHCVPTRARARVHLRRYRPISPAEEEEMQMRAIVLREQDFGISPATGEDLLVDTHYVRKGRRRRMREGDVVEVGGRIYVALGDAVRPAASAAGGDAPTMCPTPPTERRRRRHRRTLPRLRRTSMREQLARNIPVRKLLELLRLGRRNECEQCNKIGAGAAAHSEEERSEEDVRMSGGVWEKM